jgi:hypothetical protein
MDRECTPSPAGSRLPLSPISFPGLSRCGVSDGSAPQRGASRIGQPIRGPGAGQSRQPQRVQPGGFFRPLFGRSKRGPTVGSDRQEVRSTGGLHRGEHSIWYSHQTHHVEGGRVHPSQRSVTECRRKKTVSDKPPTAGLYDGPCGRQGERLRKRRRTRSSGPPRRNSAKTIRVWDGVSPSVNQPVRFHAHRRPRSR